MASTFSVMLRVGNSIAALLFASVAHAQNCQGTLYLTFDTGHMAPAEEIAQVLNKHAVKATFFLADEKTRRGDTSLDPAWSAFWKARADEGHRFGSHTWRHWYFRGDTTDGRVIYRNAKGEEERLDAQGVCAELKRVDSAFHAMTGKHLDPIWRAPGGKTTPRTLEFARQCGYRHVGWSDAGFSGDELPSEKFPSDTLIAKQLREIRDGDILLWHLGIWSRKDPLYTRLDGFLGALKAKGFCFATIKP